jgi:hypothetical protein
VYMKCPSLYDTFFFVTGKFRNYILYNLFSYQKVTIGD